MNNNILITLNDEQLTQYFENKEAFQRNLKQQYPTLVSIKLGDFINQKENDILLYITLN